MDQPSHRTNISFFLEVILLLSKQKLQLESSQPRLSWNKLFAFPELRTTLACKIPFGSYFVGCINSKHVCSEQIYNLQKTKADSNS